MEPSSRIADAWADFKEVLGISFPVIVAMASHTAMRFVDTWMLAAYGADELASVGPAASMAFTLIAFVMGTAGCTSTFVAQSVGMGRHEECARYTWQGVYFGLVAQVVAVPVLLAGPVIFELFGHEPRLQELETLYFRVRLGHVAATAAYASISSFFQGIGRPSVPMWAALIANLFNALADYVLIFGKLGLPAMGIGGAAIGTSLAMYVQAALLLGWFLCERNHRRFRTRSHYAFDAGRLWRLLAIGAPAGASFMLGVATWALFTNLLIGPLGRNALAANNVTHAILGLSFMPAVGINKGVTVLVGQYIGRRDIPAAKRRAYLGVGMAMGYMVCMGLLFVIFRTSIVRLFRDEPAIVEAGSTMLVLAAVFQAFDALGIVCNGALKGAGDTRFPVVVGIASGWGVLLPLGYLLTYPLGLGYVGAWSAAAIHIALVGSLFFWRFASEAWRKIDIFKGHGVQAP
ncbi:MAG: MATE family efflux transporter [Candidatus Brocadiia bacterium]